MGIVIGVVLYLLVVSGLIYFGKFLKECDQTMFENINAHKKYGGTNV